MKTVKNKNHDKDNRPEGRNHEKIHKGCLQNHGNIENHYRISWKD